MKAIRKNQIVTKAEIIKATIICLTLAVILLYKTGTVLGAVLFHLIN